MRRLDRYVIAQFLSVFIFWVMVAVPVSFCSGLLAAWPSRSPFPWIAAVAASIGVVISAAVHSWLHTTPKETAGRAALPRRICAQAIPAVVSAAVAVSVVAIWTSFGSEGRTDWNRVGVVGVATLFGTGAFALSIYAHARGWIARHTAVMWERKRRRAFWAAVFISIVVALVCVALGHIYDPERNRPLWFHVIDNPGGVFAFLMGVATLAGVYLTMQSILESERMITTFPQLLERLCELIDHTDQETDYVRYLCYTPLTGVWATRKELWERFQTLMVGTTRCKSVVTLECSDLERWFTRFSGRSTVGGKINADRIRLAVEQAEKAIASLDLHARQEGNDRLLPVRLRYEQMPGFYFFSNDQRAIIVSPMFLPLPEGTSRDTQVEKLQSVQVVGLETTDPHVVLWVNRLHEIYRNDVPQSKGRVCVGKTAASELVVSLDAAKTEVVAYATRELATIGKSEVGFRVHVFPWDP